MDANAVPRTFRANLKLYRGLNLPHCPLLQQRFCETGMRPVVDVRRSKAMASHGEGCSNVTIHFADRYKQLKQQFASLRSQ